MLRLPELTVYISHTCDLACESCFTYNNLNWGGHFEIDSSVEVLKDKVTFDEIFILGGEATLHPKLGKWTEWVEYMWPNSKKWIVTNGRHLDKLNLRWFDNWQIEISAHSQTDLTNIKSWLRDNNITYTKFVDNRHTDADIHYTLTKDNVVVGELSESWQFYKLPHMVKDKRSITWPTLSNINEQFSLCPTKECMHLLDGRFYRCQQQALLPNLARQFQIEQPYKDIAQQDLGSSPEEFIEWSNTRLQSQSQCQLCNWSKKIDLPIESEIKKIKVLQV